MNRKGIRWVSCWICLLAFLAAGRAYAQAPPQTQPQKEVLTNQSIIDLANLGLGPDLIIDKIRQCDHNFDTSLKGIKQLKKYKVADQVIREMLSPRAPAAAPAATAPAPAATVAPPDPNDPMSLKEPGVYLKEKDRIIQLEPTVFTQTKSGGAWKAIATYGVGKVTKKAVINGARARIQTAQSKPTFYFCFGGSTPGISFPIMGVTSPSEFVLMAMDSKERQRELVVMSGRVITGGMSHGLQSEDIQEFDSEKLAPGLYKVIPKNDLKAGEYCFYYTATSGTVGGPSGGGPGKLFDFGVEF